MRISRSAVLMAAGAVLLAGTGYLFLRSPRSPGDNSLAVLLEDFRIRNEAPKDASIETILAERDAIAAAARSKLANAGVISEREAGLADGFAGLLTAYRLPTAEQFIEFYESRGVLMDAERKQQLRAGWERTSLMTRGRRVEIDSIRVSQRLGTRNASARGAPHQNDQFAKWIRLKAASERGLILASSTPIVCLSINVPAQEKGPGSAYVLTIGFARSRTGQWLPVMNNIEGATERPVYLLPL